MAEKKRSVGLVVLTEIPEVGVVAVLQRRSPTDSYSGGCQVTCHGRIEEGEDHYSALRRESIEELGERAALVILPPTLDGLTLLVEKSDEKEDATTYGIFVPDPAFLDLLVSEDSTVDPSDRFPRLRQDEIANIQNLKNFDKRVGVTDPGVIAMFSDEAKAVRLAFEKLVP